MVHFQKVGLAVAIKHDVEAKDLETMLVLHILGYTGFVYVSQRWLRCYNRFYYQVLDLRFELLDIITTFFEMFVQTAQRPFMGAFVCLLLT